MLNFERYFPSKLKLDPITGCLNFQGSLSGGYGKLRISELGGTCYAHRVAWLLHVGALATDVDVLHKCDNPACCNPEHLFLGTHADNMRDRAAKGRYRTGPIPASEHLPTTGHRGISAMKPGFLVRVGGKYVGWAPTLKLALQLQKEKA